MPDDIPTPAPSPLKSVPGIEIAQTGQWDISTGRITLTNADLLNAVASQDCPAVRRPVLKLGHVDPRFDGEPAVGFIGNMGVNASGTTLSGDYLGMPAWLADILPSAYPDRSMEAVWDFQCQIGHVHPFVITAVALLGVTPPGIGTLESLQDIADLYDVAASDNETSRGFAVTIQAKGVTTMPNPRPTEIAAGVTTEDVRRTYYESAGMSMWITAMELDPLQLIVTDDATGQLSRIPVTMKDGGFEFADAIPVEITYTDKPAAVAASRLVYASRDESRPNTGPNPTPTPEPKSETKLSPAQAISRVHKAAQTVTTKEGGTMADVDPTVLRTILGLSPDATEEDVNTAIAAKTSTPAPTPAPVPDPTPAPTPAPTPVAAGAGVVMIDQSILSNLQKSAERGEAAFATMRKNERDSVISAAIADGKFAPARKEEWERLWDADPDGTRQTIAGLRAGLVPMNASGYAGTETYENDQAYYGLYPEEAPNA